MAQTVAPHSVYAEYRGANGRAVSHSGPRALYRRGVPDGPRIQLGDSASVYPDDLPGDGWEQMIVAGTDAEVWVHYRADDQHRWVVDNVLVRSSRVLADDLRAVPVGEIERLSNHGVIRAGANGAYVLDDEPLRREEGESADAFATRVAKQYRYYSSISRSPIKMMAEAAGVPTSTARWWVSEARRMGALPPGRAGSVG